MKNSRSTNSAKKAKTYRAAASYIASTERYFYACHAVAMHEGYRYPDTFYASRYPLTMGYANLFHPEGMRPSEAWFGRFVDTAEVKKLRVLSLCFMAAMVEAGDA